MSGAFAQTSKPRTSLCMQGEDVRQCPKMRVHCPLQVSECADGATAAVAEVAAELAAMDEPLMDVQEKFASLQRFEVRLSDSTSIGRIYSRVQDQL